MRKFFAGPILARPDYSRRFYLKTDWSAAGMGALLLQADSNPQAEAAEQEEVDGGPCRFETTVKGVKMRLRVLACISRRCNTKEKSYHGYVGEAAAGIWAIEKFRHFLFGREFTWMTDCSGLQKFFEGDDLPTHMVQRWRLQLLRYDFTIVHKAARMMADADLLSRYNEMAAQYRKS